jgi:hypothetical protein
MDYLTPWILTVAIEFIVIWIFIKRSPWLLLLYSVIINSFTLPIATYSYHYIISNIYLIELSVIIVESIFLMFLLKIKYPKALLISAAANSATAFVGFLLTFK